VDTSNEYEKWREGVIAQRKAKAAQAAQAGQQAAVEGDEKSAVPTAVAGAAAKGGGAVVRKQQQSILSFGRNENAPNYSTPGGGGVR